MATSSPSGRISGTPSPSTTNTRSSTPPTGSISFIIRPPTSFTATSSKAFAPTRPSPLSRSSAAGPPSRNKFAGRAGEGSGSDEEEHRGRPAGGWKSGTVEVSGFGEDGGLESLNGRPKGPLVINPEPNRDWRQSSMARPTAASRARERKPTYVPEGPARGPRDAGPVVERSGDEPVRAGLSFVKREAEQPGDQPMADGSDQHDVKPTGSHLAHFVKPEREETLEEKALRALMQVDSDGKPTGGPDLVIGMASQDELSFPVDETDAFMRDVLTRPEESTLDDYASTPIEAFGEALLRGMGWNPAATSASDTKIHAPKKRPAGLGLGATARPEAPAEGSGSGSQRKSEKQKREEYKNRSGRGYMPVMKKERDSSAIAPVNVDAARASNAASRSTRPFRSPSPSRSDRGDRDRHKDRAEREPIRSRDSRDDRRSPSRRRDDNRDNRDDRRRLSADRYARDERRDRVIDRDRGERSRDGGRVGDREREWERDHRRDDRYR